MRVARFLAVTILAAAAGAAHAQSTAASGSVIVIPVVAETVSYTSEVVVRNPNSTSLTLNVKFYEALTSTTPGRDGVRGREIHAGHAAAGDWARGRAWGSRLRAPESRRQADLKVGLL